MSIAVKQCRSADEVRALYREVHKRIYTAPPRAAPPPTAIRVEVRALKISDLDAIKCAVAGFYKVPPALMAAAYKGKLIIWPRFVAIHLCRKLTKATTTQIGACFGGRDHATIISALQRVDERLHRSHEFTAALARVQAHVTDHFTIAAAGGITPTEGSNL